MKKIIMTAAILGLTATGALAADQDITLTATVEPFCSIANATGTTASISTVATTGLTSGSPASPTMDVICNKASTVTLASENGAVTLGNVQEGNLSAVANFRNKIEYTASINGGAGAVSLATGGGSATANGNFATAAVSTTATAVTITPETSAVPLLAGSYQDKLTVTINPAL